MERDVLNVTEAADFLRISRTTLYRLIAAGEIPVHKIGKGRGGRVLFRRVELDAWLKKKPPR